nr:ribonuclease H-like domain-containing protein [Tanacetum cinerariifolium]
MIKFVKEADCPRVIKINNTKNSRKSTVKYAEMYRNISKDNGETWPKDNYTHKSMTPRAVLLKSDITPIVTMEKMLRSQLVGFGDLNKILLNKVQIAMVYQAIHRIKLMIKDIGTVVALGGKITGKGIIKTGKLEFENVYFVKELKYNLFSVSQICDNKNSVLFTDSECLVLGKDFKLNDDTNVLLRTPRQHNMYSIDLNNIFPHKNLTCLVAKASVDENNTSGPAPKRKEKCTLKQMQTHVSKVNSCKALDANLVVMESNQTKSRKQDTSNSSRYLTHVVDADIRPVNDQVPFTEVQLTAQHNVLANEQQHTEQSEPIYDTYLLKKVDSNTTSDSTNM